MNAWSQLLKRRRRLKSSSVAGLYSLLLVTVYQTQRQTAGVLKKSVTARLCDPMQATMCTRRMGLTGGCIPRGSKPARKPTGIHSAALMPDACAWALNHAEARGYGNSAAQQVAHSSLPQMDCSRMVFWQIPEVARIFKCSKPTIYRLMASGQLP